MTSGSRHSRLMWLRDRKTEEEEEEDVSAATEVM
jgi:hypothetical protein